MSNIRKMTIKQAKEHIQSVVDSYECMKPDDPDVEQRVYRKVWLSAKDIEAMCMALDLMNTNSGSENATNGDVIKGVFPKAEIMRSVLYSKCYYYVQNLEPYTPYWKVSDEFWNAPYNGGSENGNVD